MTDRAAALNGPRDDEGGSGIGRYSPLALIERERHVLGEIAAGLPLGKVLEDLLLAVEAESGHAMKTSVLFQSEDGRHMLHGAAPSLPDAYNKIVDGVPIGVGVGSCGTAAALAQPVYVTDIATDPLWADFRDLALGFGLRACWSMPIKASNDVVLGTFAVYYGQPRSPTPSDINAISFIARTAALAIERHRSDLDLRRSQRELLALNADLERQVIERARLLSRREADLRDTQDFARLALSAVGGVGVWTYDLSSDLYFYDAFIAELYGIDPARGTDGLPRSDYLKNVHPDDRAALKATMSGGLVKPGDLELEYRLRHPNGTVRWVLSRAHTYHDESGKAVRRTGVGIETTSQRQTEEALRQSQKMEAVGQLIGGVAHDFNNLLTVIRSSADLLKRPNLTEERRGRYIGAISDTVDRATKLTGQLLAFARRQALKPEVFAVNDSVMAIGEMLGTLTGPRIEVVTHLPDEPCWINADPSQFDTALVNMAVNARDAMVGEGRLTIAVAPVSGLPAMRSHEATVGSYVAVSIADTGSGIPPAHVERIFEPFFTTKQVGQGTGLGLSQVFGFAKQSGGEVTVASEVGVGTTFTLYLPRVAEGPRAIKETAGPEPLREGHGTSVLVVEDNSEVGVFAVQTLAELGYVVVLASNAEQALAELADDAERFDVVFTDVVMPGMNGIDLAKTVRERHPDLPVVLTSGYSHVLAQGGTHGFELLHKPYSVDELSNVLSKIVGLGRRNRARSP